MDEIAKAELSSGLVPIKSWSNEAKISERIAAVQERAAVKFKERDSRIKELDQEVPLEYYETQILRNADEARYFRRRGWELIDRGEGKIQAVRFKTVSPFKHSLWAKRINGAGREKRALLSNTEKQIADLKSQISIGSEPMLRQNYFAHFYDNDPSDLAKVIFKWKGESTKIISNRHAEERVFDTLADAERLSKEYNKVEPAIPVLKPIYDPLEVLRRRWETSINNRMNKDLVERAEAKFGKLPFDVQWFYDLTPAQKVKLLAGHEVGESTVRAPGGTCFYPGHDGDSA